MLKITGNNQNRMGEESKIADLCHNSIPNTLHPIFKRNQNTPQHMFPVILFECLEHTTPYVPCYFV
jgi:hypothetical protein